MTRELVRNSIRVALDSEVHTLDPVMHRSRAVAAVVKNIFDSLVSRDAKMNYVPQLASSWEADGERWTFRLRDGVRFHNGESLTAADVKFTIDRVIGAISGSRPSPRRDLLGPIEGAEAVDEQTVVIYTKGPYPILDQKLVFQEICPRAYFEKAGPEKFAERPVGSGPFRFVDWRPGERIVLERSPGYYLGPAGAPENSKPVAGVIFRSLEEAATRVASLEAREIEVAVNLPPDRADQVESMANAHLSVAQGTRTHFLGMNVTSKPFSDRRVREAMRWAIDPQPIVEQFLLGQARALPGMLVPIAFAYDSSLPTPKQDMRRCRNLLREGGFPEGFQTVLDCQASDKRMAEALGGSLAKAGVRIRVRAWKAENLLNQLRKGRRAFFLSSWGNASLDPSGILPVLFHSNGYSNYFGYRDAEVDRLLEEADRTMDKHARAAKYRRVQQILYRDAPTCFQFALKEMHGVDDRVEGFEARPDGMLPMHDVALVS